MRPTKYHYHFVRGCGEIESENETRILSSSCRRSGFLLRRGAPQSLAHAASSVFSVPLRAPSHTAHPSARSSHPHTMISLPSLTNRLRSVSLFISPRSRLANGSSIVSATPSDRRRFRRLMKLGSRSASPFYCLRNKLLIHEDEYCTDELLFHADVQPLDGEEVSVFWEDLQRETSSRKRIYGDANSHRIERELVERFGVFKAFVAHPYS